MTKVSPFLKAVVALVYGLAGVVLDAATDNVITSDEWRQVVYAVVGALLVFFVPNKKPAE